MCNFFSFISDGKGNVKYFTLEQREQFYKNNPKQYKMDSHSSIAGFYYGKSDSDDRINKYEFNRKGFIIDQINVEDDSEQVKKWLNEFIKTKEYKKLYETAVEQNGIALKYVPEQFINKELCEKAVEQKGDALQYVPEQFINKELYEKAVKQNGYALKYIPEHLIDYNLCEKAVKQNGWSLRYVPKKYITKELCEVAVKQDGYVIQYVPMKYRTIELCEIAVKRNKDVIY